jgi:hypothetical protein
MDLPEEFVNLYQGKSNFIIDRFYGLIGFNEQTKVPEFSIIMFDSNGTQHREHAFDNPEVYIKAREFLLDCGLIIHRR